ncbi:hypothetical protein FSP39_011799 [Pinctada imbricata]|uniref:Uncharacterized protein n=1 Tax=Pinctada imbricata TaxID=66713 RepID=A0AA88Y291_PINIB|nr:hypothetical protein FSP39_011799 [Pinctada imbricata]
MGSTLDMQQDCVTLITVNSTLDIQQDGVTLITFDDKSNDGVTLRSMTSD